MNILFLTIGRFASIEAHSIYADLLRCFRDHGHEIYTITPYEKKTGKKTELVHEKGAHILHIETGNVTGANNLISKGIAQVSLEPTFIKAIKQHFSDVKFAVEFVKKRDGAKSYLLLKDIFPQNAVDLGMLTKSGVKGFIYKYFRRKEKRLYALSDYIGCMSEANVKYVLDHNPEVDPKKVEVCPNSVEVVDQSITVETRKQIREKYGIPQDKRVFIYGGNLGKPQGIDHMIECFKSQKDNNKAFFLIIGSGTEFGKIEEWVKSEPQENVKLMSKLPKEDYIRMVGSCDIGLLFLDHRFTIPNFPSRLVDYMQSKLPTLACTDPNSDVGQVMIEGGFGWWCESNSTEEFGKVVEESMNADLKAMGEKAFRYLDEVWNVKKQYADIAKTIGWIQ